MKASIPAAKVEPDRLLLALLAATAQRLRQHG